VPEDQRVRGENFVGDGGIEIEPHRLYLRDLAQERSFDRGFVVSEFEFFGAKDDNGGAAAHKGFDHALHG
jgi:hypothetical protein